MESRESLQNYFAAESLMPSSCLPSGACALLASRVPLTSEAYKPGSSRLVAACISSVTRCDGFPDPPHEIIKNILIRNQSCIIGIGFLVFLDPKTLLGHSSPAVKQSGIASVGGVLRVGRCNVLVEGDCMQR